MVSTVDVGSFGAASRPDRDHCIVLFGEFMLTGAEVGLGDNFAMDQHLIQGGVEILLV